MKGEIIAIPDTVHCEDLHYYAPSGTLFTACEDNADTRFKWFPGLANFDDPELASKSRGSIHVIDPKVSTYIQGEILAAPGPLLTAVPDYAIAPAEVREL
jgi:hypothetical protein